MAGKEVQAVATRIVAVTRADATLIAAMGGAVRIAEEGNAPVGYAYPYFTYLFVDDIVHSAVGPPTPAYSEGFWQIKAIDESNQQGTVETLWQRLNTVLLTMAEATVNGVVVGPAQLQGNIRYVEHDPNGTNFQHRGGRYTIDAYETP